MAGNTSSQPEFSLKDPGGDRIVNPTVSASSQTDTILMAEVNSSRQNRLAAGAGRACEVALQQYLDTSPDIFKVRSGEFRGMRVPENLRCGIFQSNVAVEAGLINPRDVTVRALEFGALMQRQGFRAETFDPKKNYPNGTYIVGEGARDGTNSRHVGIICDGQLIHTNMGRVRNEPVSNKFFPGAYDRMRVYIPPRPINRAEIDANLMQA
jgi:hypothetical protein